ncbi:MAG: ABC transporter permease [Terriglobia bacterium]
MVNRMILANVLHRPIRTIVSVLAVAIEVGMVLLVVGMTNGMLHEGAKRVEGVGADVMVQPPGSSFFLGLTVAPMPIKLEDLLKNVAHVQAVAPVLLTFNTTNGLNLIYGIDMASFDSVSGGFVYYQGHPLEQPDDILVDDWYARANKIKLGQTLALINHDFHVAGIVGHGKGARIFVSLNTMEDLMGAHDKASIFFVKCTDPGYTDDVVQAFHSMMPKYQIMPVREYMSMMTSNNLPALTDFVRAMIAVAVAIGFLVIFLAMYTTITERTREIGILKSLGASKIYIIQAILQEAGLLGVAGIIAGCIGTVAARRLVMMYFPTISVDPLDAAWVYRAVLLALGGALVGAFYPALRAAQLDPVDALAYE